MRLPAEGGDQWALLDSNQQPIGYEPTALTIELRALPSQPIESPGPCNPKAEEPVANDFLSRLFDLQDRVLDAVRGALAHKTTDELSRSVRDDAGDTIFGIDVPAEDALISACEEWGRAQSFLLMAEGLEPEGRRFGSGDPEFRLIVDPVDGSRGLMHDKRSAWCLSAVASERGEDTRMEHVFAACMTELPTTKQGYIDRLWTSRGEAVQGHRKELATGDVRALSIQPSQESTLHNGFGTVADYFPGGKEIIGRVAEKILTEEMGGWNPNKANVFSDQYISSGGQLAELILGRDRFVMDIRPLVFRKLGAESSLCALPYDLCTTLIAEQTGVIVTEPDGSPFNPPLDITTNVAFAAYANAGLAARMQPIVSRVLHECGLL